MIDIWLLRDPETQRISLQRGMPTEGSTPFGRRGDGWEYRQGQIEEEPWERLLRGELPDGESDELHQRLWREAR